MDVIRGSAAALWVDFISPTGLQIPDDASVRYSLYDQVGTALLTDQTITPDANASGVSIQIDAAHNTIASPRRFEKRLVIVSWTTGGQSYSTRKTYRIVPVTTFTAAKADVRGFLGLNEDELTDDEIDLFAAYLQVETDTLNEALTSGTAKELAANTVIVMQAVLDILPSVKLRALGSLTNGPVRAERMRATPDWGKVERDARNRMAHALSVVTGVTQTNPTLIILSVPTDPITGA